MLICERNAHVNESDDNDKFQSIEDLDYFINILCIENASEMDSDASPRSSTSMEFAELTNVSTQIPPNQTEIESIEDNEEENGSSSSDGSEVNLPAGVLDIFIHSSHLIPPEKYSLIMKVISLTNTMNHPNFYLRTRSDLKGQFTMYIQTKFKFSKAFICEKKKQ